MSLVGKKFPNITVDAISKMGDNLRINISGIQRTSLSYVLPNYTLSKNSKENSKNAILLL